MISSALELPVKSSGYVHYSQDPPVLTTREVLPRYLKDFEKLSDFKKYDRMEEILEEARVYVRYLEDAQTPGSEVCAAIGAAVNHGVWCDVGDGFARRY